MSNPPVAGLSPWTLTVALCGLSFVFLWPTWNSLHDFWVTSNRFSHGHLIVLISAYLIYAKRDFLAQARAQPCYIAFLPLAALLFVWLVAILASIQAIHQVVLPAIIWFMLLAVLGWTIARSLWAQVAYLYFAIPVWESGNYILQWITVQVVGLGLWVLRVPAFIEGTFINLPTGAFEVEDRCSGLHYLIVAIALSVLYSLLYLRNARSRLLVILVAMAMALLTNWLRVFVVVYAGHLSDMQHFLVTHDHYYFGWVLFAVFLVPYLMFARRLEGDEKEGFAKDHPGTALPGRPVIALSMCVAVLAVFSGTAYANLSYNNGASAPVQIPGSQTDWVTVDSGASNWRPYYVGASGEVFERHSGSSGVVDVYFNIYSVQSEGRELIGYENRIEGANRWSVSRQIVRKLDAGEYGGGRPIRVVTLRDTGGEQRVLYLWYDIGGAHITGDLEAKIMYGINVLRGRRDAGVRIVSAMCEPGCEEAEALIRKWLGDRQFENGDT